MLLAVVRAAFQRWRLSAIDHLGEANAADAIQLAHLEADWVLQERSPTHRLAMSILELQIAVRRLGLAVLSISCATRESARD